MTTDTPGAGPHDSPPERIVIRKATVGDIEVMSGIRQAVRENWKSEDELRSAGITSQYVRRLLETTGNGWVAECNGRAVGYSIANEDTGAVWAIFVLPDFEGRGIGRALMHEATSWLEDRGVAEIWLRTGGDPPNRAHRFYKSLGWKDGGLLPDGDRKYVWRPSQRDQ